MALKYPAIPEPTLEPTSLRDSILSLKQAFEILSGQRGNPDYRAVLLPELADVQAALTDIQTIVLGALDVWTTYTPTVGAFAGTLTSAAATGTYKAIGKTIIFTNVITITTNGTANTYLSATLPVTPLGRGQLSGNEYNSGHGLAGFIDPATLTYSITKYDGSYPGVDGAILVIGGSYEST